MRRRPKKTRPPKRSTGDGWTIEPVVPSFHVAFLLPGAFFRKNWRRGIIVEQKQRLGYPLFSYTLGKKNTPVVDNKMAGFNKMFVMVPVMLAARKLDGEDPNVVYWLRVAYFSVQSLMILLVAYTYIQATTIASKPGNDRTVYIPPAASVRVIFLL